MPQDRAQQTSPTTFTLALTYDPREQLRERFRTATADELAALTPDERAFAEQQGVLLPSRRPDGSLLSLLAQAPSVSPALPMAATDGMLAPSAETEAPPADWTQRAISMGLRTVPAIVGGVVGSIGGPLGTAAGGALGSSLGELLGQRYDRPDAPVNPWSIGVAGALGAVPGLGAGRTVTRLGLNAAEAALPAVTSALADNAVRRTLQAAGTGMLLAPPSTVATNWAEGRPLAEGMFTNTALGGVFGAGMGGAMEAGRAAAPYVARGSQQAGEMLQELAAQYQNSRFADETGAVGNLGTRAPVGIERGQFVMSNRIPKAVPEGDQPLATNIDVVRAHPELEARVADAVRLSPLVTAKQARLSPRGVTDAFVDTARQNLDLLVRQMGQYAEGARQWYDGAHAIARALSGDDFTTNQTSGVLAVMSPQKDWHQNAELGRQIVDGYRLAAREDLPFSQDLFQHYANSALLSSEESITKRLRDGTIDAAQAEKLRLQKRAQIAEVGTYTGRRFSALPLHAKARMLRALGEQEFGFQYPIIAPDGSLGDLMRNKPKKGKPGEPTKLAWNGYGMVEKAIAILEDGSPENISLQLGSEHKVRAFYNNINAPWSALASTVDTHQVAASHLQPMAQSHPSVALSMGGVSHKGTGISGTNPLYQEALLREARKMGLLPRELQSITWEGLKGLWSPDEKRNAATAATVRKLWNEYRQGRRSLEQTQSDIMGLVQFTPPVWAPR